MIEYQKILFPTDLSEKSFDIIPHVRKMAKICNAEIHMVYVASPNEYHVEDENEPGQSIRKKVLSLKDAHFNEISDNNVAVMDGEVDLEILSYLERKCIDLVIMSVKGRTALGKAVFGSTAAQIVRAAGVPVMLVNPREDKFLVS